MPVTDPNSKDSKPDAAKPFESVTDADFFGGPGRHYDAETGAITEPAAGLPPGVAPAPPAVETAPTPEDHS